MKTTKQRLVDTLAWGFGLWLIGFTAGMMLFPFVPIARLGWFIVPAMTVVIAYVAYRRLKRSEATIGYSALVGVAWLVMAVLLDYILLVKTFATENYYDADIFVYYALVFLIPVLVGWRFGANIDSTNQSGSRPIQ